MTVNFVSTVCRAPDCSCILSTSHGIKWLVSNDTTAAVHTFHRAFVSQAAHRVQEVDKVEDEGIS